MVKKYLTLLKYFFKDISISCLGFPSFLVLKIAERYSNKIQLAKCNSVAKSVIAGKGLIIGNDGFICMQEGVTLCERNTMLCYSGGSINIGKNVFIGPNGYLASEKANISIGDDSLISGNVSVIACNHGTIIGIPIRSQRNIIRDIIIGKDVWIGMGVSILAGSQIADGCVVGANSVVLGSTEPNTIYAGVPIRKIRLRSQQ